MQDSTSIITSSISYDNRKIKTSLHFCPEATARVIEALTPYANEEFCPPDFENLPRDDSELNTPDDSPPPSSPASSPSIMVPERCSSDPLVSSGNQDQIVSPDPENEDQLVELLLYVKRTDIVNCDSALESKFFDALKPKESPQKKVLKYEYVSHTCEEHRKKHLRCPFNCKGRIVSRVPKLVSEDQIQDTISIEDMELEGPASPITYTPRGKISRSSSFSSGMEKDAMDSDDEDYSVESPKTKQQRKEAKKRQTKYTLPKILQNSFGDDMSNRVNTQKQQQEKDRIKRDREERVRARRIAAIRDSLKALEHSYDEDSDVERVMSEQVQWLQDDKLFQEQNEKIINGKKKPFGTKTDVANNDSSSIFSGLSVAVNSNAVNTTSSSDDSKGRRWVRFACERHRKEHAKCPENCPNRMKQEMSMSNSDADKPHLMGISST